MRVEIVEYGNLRIKGRIAVFRLPAIFPGLQIGHRVLQKLKIQVVANCGHVS